jgi:hypothetical protein
MQALSGSATDGSNDADGEALPPVETTRWVARRKAAVVNAVAEGRLGRVEACTRYGISDVELRLWERAIACVGVPGLRVTRVQIYRPIFEAKADQ